jgi:aminoglycoside/choline kinase family phosphotransferase
VRHAFPTRPEELDAESLTAALSARHPGVRVAGVELLELDELTNTHARVRLDYDQAAGAPATMFCKLPPLESARRATIAATGMGPREARFYATLGDDLALRTPMVHAAHTDDGDGDFLLLLEDLGTTGCTVSDGTVGVTPDAAAIALEELADLHVRYEDPARRAAEAGWVVPATAGSDYGAVMLRYGLDHHRNRLNDAFADIAELYIEQRVAMHDVWTAGPQTVIHGDPHLGNVFDDHGRTGFLDWGIIRVSTPLRDVCYFIQMAMDVEDRRRHERDLLAHYLGARRAAGGIEIDADEAWLRHRLHAAYTVPASCQVVLFPPDMTERRRVFSEAFLARALAAVEDLDAVGALREAGIG